MAAQTVTFATVQQQIASGKLAPVYLLHGEESYYLDELVKQFENVLSPEDKEFNQYVLYAPQVLPGEVMDLCRRFPMMADRQMVILKEAQGARADQINRLHKYVQQPASQTTLVIVFRGEKAKGKELLAAAKAKAVVFESKKVPDWQILPMIATLVKQKGLSSDQKPLEMLRDFIGTDLSRLYNEIDKLAALLPAGAAITPEIIERHIGVSKDYNNFELVEAMANKDMAKALRIVEYFAANPKKNPTTVANAMVFSFFSDLLVAYYAKDKSDAGILAAVNGTNKFVLYRMRNGMRNYNAYQVIEAIWTLRQFDRRSKGLGSRQNEYDLFREAIYHVLTAPGSLFEP